MARINWASLFSYLLVGTLSVGSALYLVSQFVAPSLSQSSPAMASPQPPTPVEKTNFVPQGTVTSENAIETPSGSVAASSSQGYLQPYMYDAESRRDPFKPYQFLVGAGNVMFPVLPMQRYDLKDIRLVGIIWDVRQPKAMFMDPNSQIHVLSKDDRIGRNNGYVATIREGEVVVVETVSVKGEPTFTTQVMKIKKQ